MGKQYVQAFLQLVLLGPAHGLLECLLEVLPVDGLEQIGHGGEPKGLHGILFIGGCDNQAEFPMANLGKQIEAPSLTQLNVEKNNVGPQTIQSLDCLPQSIEGCDIKLF